MSNLRDHGFAVADITLSPDQCDHIALSIPSIASARAGVRGLIDHPTILQLLRHPHLGRYLWSVVGRDLVAVKATLFDEAVDAGGRVTWHQDRVITVRERMEIAGFSGWSSRAGVVQVEPPAHVLEQMLVLRVHLDACGPENGPLRVVPGTHELGKLPEAEIARIASDNEPVELCVAKGAIVVMRPLLLHAATPARVASHRRVLHIEFAPLEAISPLLWERAVHLRSAA